MVQERGGKKIIAEGGHTAPAGQFKGDESFFKCFDMGGNVREWVNDWYQEDYYKVGPKKSPLGPTEEEATLIDGKPSRVARQPELSALIEPFSQHASEPRQHRVPLREDSYTLILYPFTLYAPEGRVETFFEKCHHRQQTYWSYRRCMI